MVEMGVFDHRLDGYPRRIVRRIERQIPYHACDFPNPYAAVGDPARLDTVSHRAHAMAEDVEADGHVGNTGRRKRLGLLAAPSHQGFSDCDRLTASLRDTRTRATDPRRRPLRSRLGQRQVPARLADYD